MATKKKTFYEILAVAPTATDEEIQANYQSLTLTLRSQKKIFTPDEYELKLKIIDLAFKTLLNHSSRNAYDAELAAGMVAAGGSTPPAGLVLQPDASAISLKAEAIALRAEAISLRVDALAMKSDVAAFGAPSIQEASGQTAVFAVMPNLRKIAMFLGVLLAGWMVVQVFSLLMLNRHTSLNDEAAAKANEKVIIQEYYQTHGVRASSKAEVQQLEAEARRKEAEDRQLEREKIKAEENAKDFEKESRIRAEQVSSELRYSENQAQEQARREEAEKKREQELEKKAREEAENNRIEKEKQRWQETLRR
jgi:curved DNA-binding protein CbpA